MFRRVLKISGITLLAVIVMLLLIASPPRFMAPWVQPVRMSLVSVVTDALSRSLNGTIEIDAIEGSLLSAPLARGVILKDAQGEQIMDLDTLSLRYSLADLFSGRLRIHELLITRPRLRLAWDEHGQSNLLGVFPPGPADAESDSGHADLPISIILERVNVRSGAVNLIHRSLPGAREIEDIALELSAEIGEGGLHLEVQSGIAQVSPAAVNLDALRGTLSMTAGRVQLDGWLLTTGESQIRLERAVPGSSRPAGLQLDLAPLNVGELGRLLGEHSLQGEVRGVARAEGPAEVIELDGRFTAGVGEILITGALETRGRVPDYQGTVQLAKLDLSDLIAGDAYGGDINAKLRVRGSGNSRKDLTGELELLVASSRIGNLVIQPSEVRIAVGSDRVRVERFEIQTTAFTAALEGEVDLAGRSALDYRIAVELDKLRGLIDANALAGEGQLSGKVGGSWPDTYIDGRFEASGIRFDDGGVREMDLQYRIDGLKRGPRVAAALEAQSARVGGIGIEAATADIEYSFDDKRHQARLKAHVVQSASFETNLDGVFVSDGRNSKLTLEQFGARLDDHDWHNATPMRFSFAPDGFLIEPVRLEHGDASIQASGGLQGDRFEDLLLRASNIDLTFLSRITALPAFANGRGDLAVGLNGTPEAPVLDADFVLRTEHDHNPPFEQAGLNLSYALGRLQGEAYVAQDGRQVLMAGLELPVDLALNGTSIERRLVDAPLRVNLAIDRPSLETLSAGFPNMPSLAGTLQGRVDVSGSYTDLAIDSDLDLEGITVPAVIEGIKGPLVVGASVEMAQAPTVPSQSPPEDSLTLYLRSLEARSRRIVANLPGGPSRQIAAEELVFEAIGAWDSSGITGEVRNLHTLASVTGLPDTEIALAALRSSEEGLKFDRISVTTGKSEVRGEGDIVLEDRRLAFQWQIPRLELREFVTELPRAFPSLVSGRMDVRGTMRDPVLTTRLEYAGSKLIADIKLGLADTPPKYQADLRISDLDLARFDPDGRGDVTASIHVQGTGLSEDDLKARIKAAIDSKDFDLAPELMGRLHADVSGQSLDVETLQLQSTGFEIQAQGILSSTRASDFGYHLIVRDLASLKGYVSGDLQVRGKLDGKIAGNQGKLNNVSTLKVEQWRYLDWQGGEVGAALEIDDLLVSRHATISAELTDLQGPQLASTNLRLDGTYRSDQGDFSLAVTEGPFTQSLIAGQLTTEQGVQIRLEPFRLQHDDWIWKNTEPIQVTSDATGTVTINDLNLASVNQLISARGSWSPGGAITLAARADGLQIGPNVDALAPGTEGLDGLIDADLTVTGTLEQPRIDAALQATALRWRQQSLGEIDARLGTAGPVLTGRARWVDQKKALLTLEGRIDRSASNAITADVLAPDLDLSVLEALSPEVLHSDGRLRLDLTLGGTLDQPQAQGTLDLRDGELQLAAIGTPYTGIQSRVVFDGTQVKIKQLQVQSPTGAAELNGWIGSAGLSVGQVDLELSTDRFTILDTPALAAVVSSDIALRGSGEDLLARGALEVVRARLRYDALPSTGPPAVEPWELTVEGVFGAGVQEDASGIEEQSGRTVLPLLPFLRTDIQVNMPGNSWVRGNGTAVEIAGDVRVKKALEHPFTLAGDVRAVRGFATFFGNRFIVEKGQIRFTGSEEIDPILEVEASHQVAGYKAYVDITGSVSEPVVSFRSDPELAESDVISLLIFGRTSDQLSGSERSSLGNHARRLAGQLAAGVLERHVGETLGLDSVAVDLGDETTRTSVGVGRYISQNVFLFYERTLRDPRRENRSGNTVGIEKRLNQRQTLKATGSDLGETAVDWLWRYDY